jgi:hypothetical protein
MSNAPYEKTKSNNIFPCTLSMLSKLNTTTEDISFQNHPIETIETVAKISEMRETALRFEFSLFDFTGKITAYAYKNVSTGKPKFFQNFELIDNGYVLIIAGIRKNQENASIIITQMQNVFE